MRRSYKYDTTSKSVFIELIDATDANGGGKTGLLAANLTAGYCRNSGTMTNAAIVLSDLATLTAGYTAGGIKEVSGTNVPGTYRFDIPDVCLQGGAGDEVKIIIKGAGVLQEEIDISLLLANDGDAMNTATNVTQLNRGLLAYYGTTLTCGNSPPMLALQPSASGYITPGCQVMTYADKQVRTIISWDSVNKRGNIDRAWDVVPNSGDTVAVVNTRIGPMNSTGELTNLVAVKAKTDNLPADPADASDIAGQFTTLGATVGQVKAKTDALPADPVGVSDLAAGVNLLPTAFDSVVYSGMSYETILTNIFAAVAGKNSGVGTPAEVYCGPDGAPAFTSHLDTANNRTSVEYD